MLCIALTGTIASGKSTVAKIFEQYAVPVLYSDKVAKEITQADAPCYQPIIEYFGPAVRNEHTGELNRRFLREQIFQDATKRKWLEALMHPIIRKILRKRVHELNAPYCLIEIPLLYERRAYPFIQRVLLIIASEDIQIQRIQERDNASFEEAKAILASQPDEKLRRRIADDIIVNDGSREELQTQIAQLHKKYLVLADS